MIVEKTNWVSMTLSEVCDIINGDRGKNYPAKSKLSSKGVYPFISAVNLDNYSVSTDNLLYLSHEQYERLSNGKIIKGDIALCIRGSLGKFGFFPFEEGAIASSLIILRSKEILNQQFLGYYLKSQTFEYQLKANDNGIAQPNIGANKISLFKISLPKKEEQICIANELNAVQELFDGYTAQLKDLDILAKSIYYEMFGDPVNNEKGWKTTKLKNVTKLITNGNTPKGGEKVYVNDGIMFFRSQNVWRNELKLDDIAYIDEETNSALKSSILHHNDILITKTGRINTENSSLGRPALFIGEDNTANINGHVYLVRLTEEVNPIYYLYALLSDSFKELIRNVCVGAIDKRQLNRTHIEDFPVMLAPIEMQEKFASQVEAIEKQKALLREQLADAEQLMAERMQYYFS